MQTKPHVCAVLASDASFFHQTRAAIESIRRSNSSDLDIRLIAIGPFAREQLAWLEQTHVEAFSQLDDIPRFNGGPEHSLALSCRPFLPQMFPQYDGFVWIDSDVRIVDPTGLDPWVAHAGNPECPLAVVHEAEATYTINAHPAFARAYHLAAHARMLEVYGPDVAVKFECFKLYNAGLFAMPAVSPMWARYRANLERALSHPFDRMREQDALNVAIVESQEVRALPSTLNWLCSLALPWRGQNGEYLAPDCSERRIKVAHLTASSDSLQYEGRRLTFYECYRLLGLTD